jgi:vanillate O-demethylase ferredoxin subunit
MHAVRAGDILAVSEPRNHFALVPGAEKYLLIAGGIGITPILAMMDHLRRAGADFVLHYCTRTPELTPFRDELVPMADQGRVCFHHDGGVPGCGLNDGGLQDAVQAGTQVYCCGPNGLMSAVRAATGHWPHGTVHFESFAAPALPAASAAGQAFEFEVEIASTGAVIGVPAHMSMLEALRGHGVDVDSSCEAGTCGTCITRYLSGEPSHRDFVLDEEQQREFVIVCVSRSKSRRLKVDL